MSTQETTTFKVCSCPCGKGEITQSVTSQDNPWSTADVSRWLNCAECSKDWRLEGSRLVDRNTEGEYRKAMAARMAAWRKLNEISQRVAARYFTAARYATKKAEYMELSALGLVDGSLESYYRLRKKYASVGEFVIVARNLKWMLSQLSGEELAAAERDLAAYRSAEAAEAESARKIVRRPLKIS